MTAVSIRSLTGRYPGTDAAAVEDVSLEVRSGELLALLGPSGCGKTTTMKIVAGLMAPTAGDVLFDDRSVTGLPPERRGAVMVFQNHLLFPSMTVAQNVGFGLRMRGTPRAVVQARVAEMLTRVRLADLADRWPAEVSGGQAQRVALARALILSPEVLLLDEPLSSLDAALRDEMREMIGALQRETAITTLFVTHDQDEAVAVADRVALMLEGRLVQVGPATDFYRRPRDARVARFFGGANFVPGEARGGAFHSALGAVAHAAGARQGKGVMTIRPEAIRLGPGGGTEVAAVIAGIRFLGTRTRVALTVADQRLIADLPPEVAGGLSIGQDVVVCLPSESVWVLPDE